jgi:hypothetical protein
LGPHKGFAVVVPPKGFDPDVPALDPVDVILPVISSIQSR